MHDKVTTELKFTEIQQKRISRASKYGIEREYGKKATQSGVEGGGVDVENGGGGGGGASKITIMDAPPTMSSPYWRQHPIMYPSSPLVIPSSHVAHRLGGDTHISRIIIV